ncbi:DUF1156 domain-containing protein [Arsenicicoccus sp. UBA7492]|uniref:DUF1156 domain-containing protein n=1 Tax=Arsenicicoccus sp. UBA7492 TaxID=1946057 RepID=UPI00257F92ED|nr:DUF1156 domain-containing protein [Arsenicicoccus sp. UBA7492]
MPTSTSHAQPIRRKLIEVALPLEAINRESAKEKSVRHGHPSTLHLWWARRPAAAARAFLFAQIVDDPSSDPTLTEEEQREERERLHRIVEQLASWDNTKDEALLARARAEIQRSAGGNLPKVLDPFAGGGTIPLETQRLGLEAHSSDLNPVAVLINKALIDIPPRFRDNPPVHPDLAERLLTEHGAEALVADVRAYGQWMSDQAQARIGHLYPKATLPDGSTGDVIAYLWARTVVCPNPACAVDMPLLRSRWLSKKRGRETYLVSKVVSDPQHPSGRRVTFDISQDLTNAPTTEHDGTVGRRGATCIACGTAVSLATIRAEGRAGRISSTLMAVAANQGRTRHYLPADDHHLRAARDVPAVDAPHEELGYYPRDLKAPTYGLTRFADLFTPRQLVALDTFTSLVSEAREHVLADALAAGMPAGDPLEAGGSEAVAYADAVATYLGLGVSRMTDISNALCHWENTKQQARHLFARQAIPMLWDFAETIPFGKAAGSFMVSLTSLTKAITDTGGPRAVVTQADASTRSYSGLVLACDPPYYDNIGYSDLSDFFYVWLRRALRTVHPHLLSTLLVPKTEELVANAYRHGGAEQARDFFEHGFQRVFARARESANADYPIAVYYAFKQSSEDETGTTSTGWETLLQGMIRAGWTITATWPARSELSNRMLASGKNALASSIVLSLRPRDASAPTTDRRGFIRDLQAELPGALRKLQQGAISPVDLPQAAIGPGMAVFSRYAGVLEPDGTQMSVKSALARINEILDEVLNEQEGDFDPTSRFALAWYRQHGYEAGLFGDADNLARARNTSVATMDRDEILTSRAGRVQLLAPAALPVGYDVLADDHTSNWEALHYAIKALDAGGVEGAGQFMGRALSREDEAVDADRVKELAHLLFRIAEDNGWTKDALSFNALVTSWPEITRAAHAAPAASAAQGSFAFDEEEA